MSDLLDQVLKGARPTFLHIDLEAFRRNIQSVQTLLPGEPRLIVVLKGDGYGHGAVPLARICAEQKVSAIAVALLEEALELRVAGISLPLLVFGPLTQAQMPLAFQHQILITITGPETLAAACQVASLDQPLRAHLKLDTGMGRMGLIPSDLAAAARLIRQTPGLIIEAIYTHFANAADPNDPYTEEQIRAFLTMTEQLRDYGVTAPIHHLANSPATLRGLVTPGDYVRIGGALIGVETLEHHPSTRLEPVLRWETRIMRLKEVPAGSFIGYGKTFQTKRPSLIATLPVGYADGYDRALSNTGEVLVRGHRAPVAGRVSMDLLTIDVTEVPQVAVNDEVILLGQQDGDEITVAEIAEKLQTVPYEVFTQLSPRLPRIYSSAEGYEVVSRFTPYLRPNNSQ